MPTPPEVTRAGPDDWRAVRAVRLRALAEAPLAFASTLAREEADDEDAWRARAGSGAWFLAHRGTRCVGLACGITDDDLADRTDDARMVVALWVEPAARGGGTVDALLGALTAWAAADGATLLTLWVALDNARARACYTRHGFRDDGARGVLPHHPEIAEMRMRRPL